MTTIYSTVLLCINVLYLYVCLCMLLPSVGEQWCQLYPGEAGIHQHFDLPDPQSSSARGRGPAGGPPCCSRGEAQWTGADGNLPSQFQQVLSSPCIYVRT